METFGDFLSFWLEWLTRKNDGVKNLQRVKQTILIVVVVVVVLKTISPYIP